MDRGIARFAAWLVVALCAWPAVASTIFSDGFEDPCSTADLDGDRLSGCQERDHRTDAADSDTDDDGLDDGDEVLGTLDGLNLPALGTDPLRRDMLVEVDWFDDSSEQGTNAHCPLGFHSHRPTQEMLDIVAVVYGSAPIANPDGSQGINVIFDHGQGGIFSGGSLVPDATGGGDGIVEGDVFEDDYNTHYAAHFAQNRKGYFHYVLMVHRFNADDGHDDYSGVAERSSGIAMDESMVSLFCERSARNVGFTLAHELAHNLTLRHGGDSGCNHKPNYNSIMNYRYQFKGVDTDCIDDQAIGPAAFSSGLREPLDENDLDKTKGMCGGVPIDWNGIDGLEPSIQRDLNPYAWQVLDCGGTRTVLTDFDDWSHLVLDMTPSGEGQGSNPETADVCPGPATPQP